MSAPTPRPPRWTRQDEAQLQQLTKRKQEIENLQRGAVHKLVDDFYYRDMPDNVLTDNLIARADEFIKALRPFAKEKP